jgi:hypothetical protein
MISSFRHIVFLLPVISLLVCCNHASLSPRAYTEWVRNSENGLNVNKRIGDFDFSLQYKPVEFVIMEQYKSDTVSRKSIEGHAKELDGMQYYTLRIRSSLQNEMLRAGISDESEYASRLEYFLSYAQDDIVLVENGDTLPCLLYHFERTYSLSPFNDIVLGFEKEPASAQYDKTLIFQDQALGTGPVQLTISSKDIQQIPSIHYVQD